MTARHPVAKRIVVCVSGEGTNLRALKAAERRGSLGGQIVLVLADRSCRGLEWATQAGIRTALLRPSDHPDRDAWDRALESEMDDARPDIIVLAGFMRVLGRVTLATFAGRIVNVHPSLLPAFPGPDAVGEAQRAGVRVTGVTVHLVDETLDGGRILHQEAVSIRPSDDRDTLQKRLHAVEHRLLPRAVADLLSEGAATAVPRRALVSVSDKRGLADLGRGLVGLGFELVSTGGTARALREAGVNVTDVSSVTGFPEMLDGRVKTLHPRIAAGILADDRDPSHRGALADSGIEPFQVVVVNLYPFAEAARRPGTTAEQLIEEIDIGGPTLVRAAAKNHASVAIVTDPDDYPDLLEALRESGHVPLRARRDLAMRAFAHTAAYDAAIAATLPRLLGGEPSGALPGADDLPEVLDLRLIRMHRLRYGENPHQRAALYGLPGAAAADGPLAVGAHALQGRELSYNNLVDVSAATAIARDLHGAAAVIVKHGDPCGAAEAGDVLSAWSSALAGDQVSAFGGVAAIRGHVDAALASRVTDTFLEVVIAAGYDEEALGILATRTALRVLLYEGICTAPSEGVEIRSAGGAVLVTQGDRLGPEDVPASWKLATSRPPTQRESSDLHLAWRVCRHVSSNAIVIARDGAVVGVGAGQMSRVDSARLAVGKAGQDRARGSACASDAFFPFPDGVEECLQAGVTAFVQPGGSKRDAEVIAAAEDAGATMLLTGRRHFRH